MVAFDNKEEIIVKEPPAKFDRNILLENINRFVRSLCERNWAYTSILIVAESSSSFQKDLKFRS